MNRLDDLLATVATIKTSTKSTLTGYKKGASLRSFSFELTDAEADALFRSACHYCGYKPPHRFNGIDRVVNGMGYVKGNVVACCKWCNRAKGRREVAEFLVWLRWVKASGVIGSGIPAIPMPQPASHPIAEPTACTAAMPTRPRRPIGTHGLRPTEYVRRMVWGEPIDR